MQNVTPFNYIRNNSTPQWWLGRTFLVKGVIEIIFIGKFSQNFPRHKDDSSSTTSLVCTALVGSLHNLWCGLMFYPVSKAMREAYL